MIKPPREPATTNALEERVMKALYEADNVVYGFDIPWEQISEHRRWLYLYKARFVIDSLIPSQYMQQGRT